MNYFCEFLYMGKEKKKNVSFEEMGYFSSSIDLCSRFVQLVSSWPSRSVPL